MAACTWAQRRSQFLPGPEFSQVPRALEARACALRPFPSALGQRFFADDRREKNERREKRDKEGKSEERQECARERQSEH